MKKIYLFSNIIYALKSYFPLYFVAYFHATNFLRLIESFLILLAIQMQIKEYLFFSNLRTYQGVLYVKTFTTFYIAKLRLINLAVCWPRLACVPG